MNSGSRRRQPNYTLKLSVRASRRLQKEQAARRTSRSLAWALDGLEYAMSSKRLSSFLVLVLPLYSIACTYDDNDRAHSGTLRVLHEFEVSRDPNPSVIWLTTYHGEGPGLTKLLTLLDWARSHPAEFEALADALPQDGPGSLTERIGLVVSDSGNASQFRSLFGKSASPRVKDILRACEHNEHEISKHH